MQKPRDLYELHRIESAEDEPYRKAKLSNWKPEPLEPTFRDGIERKTPKEPIDRDELNSIIDDLNRMKEDELATVVCPLCGETMVIPKEEEDDAECWLCGTLCKEQE